MARSKGTTGDRPYEVVFAGPPRDYYIVWICAECGGKFYDTGANFNNSSDDEILRWARADHRTECPAWRARIWQIRWFFESRWLRALDQRRARRIRRVTS